MISNDTIEVSVTYGSKITFFLRMITIGEEQLLRQKAFGLKEEERAEKEYSMNVQILADLSVNAPEGIKNENPTTTLARDIIEDFFGEKSAMKERIAFYAVRGYFIKLQPAESFF